MSMPETLANAIACCNSIRQFTICYRASTIALMDEVEKNIGVELLKALVIADGGPAEFARKRSQPDADCSCS